LFSISLVEVWGEKERKLASEGKGKMKQTRKTYQMIRLAASSGLNFSFFADICNVPFPRQSQWCIKMANCRLTILASEKMMGKENSARKIDSV
jgi:hypothetical protein